MNPYYQNQYQYQPQPPQYSYPQQQPSPQNYQPQQQMPNISAMYTSLHPYNNKQFLLSTFGNKMDYIQVFLTLSHEDKLMMYMLTEQRKMYGEIRDKQNYQRLLKDIAQKVHNYNLFHNNANNQPTKEVDKSKEMENRIDDFVEKTFQKLNVGKMGQTLEVQKTNKEEDVMSESDQDQDQWVDSVQGPPQFNQGKRSSESHSSGQRSSLQGANSYASPVYATFSFDSNMEEAFTHQIGLKSMQETDKKSIWDLDLAEDEVSEREISLKEVFGRKPPQQGLVPQLEEQKQINNFSKSNVPSQQNKQEFSNQFIFQNGLYSSMTSQNPTNEPNPLSFSQSGYASFNKENVVTDSWFSQSEKMLSNGMHVGSMKPENKQNIGVSQGIQNYSETSGSEPQQEISKPIEEVIIQSPQIVEKISNNIDNKDIEMDDDFGDMVEQSQQPEAIIEHFNQSTNNNKTQEVNGNLFNFQDLNCPQTRVEENNFKGQQIIQASSNVKENQLIVNEEIQIAEENVSQRKQQPQMNFDFDFLGGFTPSTQQNAQIEVIPSNGYQHTQELSSSYPQELHQNQQITTLPTVQANKYKQQSTPQLPIRQSQLDFGSNKNYDIVSPLKIELNKKDRQLIERQLKAKTFDCYTQFYQIILNYLHEISFTKTSEFNHLNQQYKTVKALHEQTDKYTMAVDEDEEDKVTQSIRRSKDLMNIIIMNSQRTQQITQTLLDKNNKEKGFLYKFGKLIVDTLNNQDILSKIMSQANQNQIQNSFYVLYCMQKMNTLSKLRINTENIMIYVNREYQRYRSFDTEMMNEVQQNSQKYPKYIQFIRGFVRLLTICERMITLLKTCSMKTQVNMVKTLKICKDIKARYASYREEGCDILLPERYREILRDGVTRNLSLYEIHADFSNIQETLPICSICLLQVGSRGQKISEDLFCHFACFNLLVEIQRENSTQ